MTSKPPYEIIKDFEHALSVYTGAPFVTCVNSCTMALRLCLDWSKEEYEGLYEIYIPKRTYISVPFQIRMAGLKPKFRDEDWHGMYRLGGTYIYDAARRFHANMYVPGTLMCVSFHYSKILGLGHGGAILHDKPILEQVFMRGRHDGRIDGMPIAEEFFTRYAMKNRNAHHCPMSPEIAAQGLVRLSTLPAYNDDLPNSDYPDLSTFEVFK